MDWATERIQCCYIYARRHDRERIQQIKSFGAEIIETPKEKFLNGSDDEAIAYAKVNKNSFYINQSENILNMESWYECGREIIKQLASKI